MSGLELKPCPFCGGAADFTVTAEKYPFKVECKKCGAIAGGSAFEYDEFNASLWNKRTTDHAEALAEALDRALSIIRSIHDDPEVLNAYKAHYDMDDLQHIHNALTAYRNDIKGE